MEWTAGRGTQELGIIGTVMGGLAVAGAPLVNGLGRNANDADSNLVSRREAEQAAEIAELKTEVKLRDSNIYTDQKLLEVYKYFDGKLDSVNRRLCEQDVWNAAQTATMGAMAQQIAALNGMTKMVIPKTNICPEPMDRYNSWTAPTTTATTAA